MEIFGINSRTLDNFLNPFLKKIAVTKDQNEFSHCHALKMSDVKRWDEDTSAVAVGAGVDDGIRLIC